MALQKTLYPIIRRAMATLLSAALLCLLSSCLSGGEEEGIVATVNNQPIYFVDMDAQRNMLFTGLDRAGNPPGDDVLKVQYAYALKQLIVQELVRQYLAEKQLLPSPEALQADLAQVRNDYGAEFSHALMEGGVSPELWQEAMSRRLMVDHFLDVVLRQKIEIEPDEIESYYRQHQDEFIVPEQWHFIEISGLEKDEVEKARAGFVISRNATAVQQEFAVTIRDIRMGKERLPERVIQEISTLAPLAPGRITREEEGFSALILLEAFPRQELATLETYKRIEAALTEDRLQAAFDKWIKKRLEKAHIRVAKSIASAEPLDSLQRLETGNGTVKGTGNGTGQNNGTSPHGEAVQRNGAAQ